MAANLEGIAVFGEAKAHRDNVRGSVGAYGRQAPQPLSAEIVDFLLREMAHADLVELRYAGLAGRPLRQDGGTVSDELIDPSGRRPRFDGAAWVSQDGKFWWNGTAWQPIARPRRVPWGVIGFVAAILVVAAVIVHQFPRQIIDTTQYGATNYTIDSTTQIEFDYRAQDSCNNLTFIYTFYDAQGIKVGEFKDSQSHQVNAGQSYHMVIDTTDPIDPSATRFTATPVCNS